MKVAFLYYFLEFAALVIEIVGIVCYSRYKIPKNFDFRQTTEIKNIKYLIIGLYTLSCIFVLFVKLIVYSETTEKVMNFFGEESVNMTMLDLVLEIKIDNIFNSTYGWFDWITFIVILLYPISGFIVNFLCKNKIFKIKYNIIFQIINLICTSLLSLLIYQEATIWNVTIYARPSCYFVFQALISVLILISSVYEAKNIYIYATGNECTLFH